MRRAARGPLPGAQGTRGAQPLGRGGPGPGSRAGGARRGAQRGEQPGRDGGRPSVCLK